MGVEIRDCEGSIELGLEFASADKADEILFDVRASSPTVQGRMEGVRMGRVPLEALVRDGGRFCHLVEAHVTGDDTIVWGSQQAELRRRRRRSFHRLPDTGS